MLRSIGIVYTNSTAKGRRHFRTPAGGDVPQHFSWQLSMKCRVGFFCCIASGVLFGSSVSALPPAGDGAAHVDKSFVVAMLVIKEGILRREPRALAICLGAGACQDRNTPAGFGNCSRVDRQPRALVCYPNFFATLPRRSASSGRDSRAKTGSSEL